MRRVDMTDINQYLIEEVVVDYADGLINRREALRRRGLPAARRLVRPASGLTPEP
jgi:hypothetical protein